MSTPALNPLVSKIRSMHPGAYDDMDDAALTKAVLAKYPQYSDLAAPAVAKPNIPVQSVPENFAEKVGANLATAYEHTKPIAQQAANDLYTTSTPNIAAQIMKRLRGEPNELHKIPQQAVMTFLGAGGIPEGEAIAPEAKAAEAVAPKPAPPVVTPTEAPAVAQAAPLGKIPLSQLAEPKVPAWTGNLEDRLSANMAKIQAQEARAAAKAKTLSDLNGEGDLTNQLSASLNKANVQKGSDVPKFVYRARDFGEEGVPLKQSHAQAGSNLDQIMKYAEPGQRSEEGNEVIRIDLTKLKPSDYVVKAHPDGSKWVQFTRPLSENEVSVLSGKSAGAK